MFREPHVYLSQGGLMLKYVAKSFAQKKTTFTNSEKYFARSHVRTLAAFVMDNLDMDL